MSLQKGPPAEHPQRRPPAQYHQGAGALSTGGSHGFLAAACESGVDRGDSFGRRIRNGMVYVPGRLPEAPQARNSREASSLLSIRGCGTPPLLFPGLYYKVLKL